MPFKKGQSGNVKGREVGSKNKVTLLALDVKDVVFNAFQDLQADPKNNLIAWAKENPTEFYKIAAKLIPTNIEAKVSNTINVIPPKSD
jgi:hypothetical protein